ncbi:MAG: phosphoribosylanthranilate isomerase [Pseudomonadota bacterium]
MQDASSTSSRTAIRTRVKICGITRVEDALAAVRAGADAIGLVFYAKSSRAVTIEQAKSILRALPPLVSTLGLFVNASKAEVEAVLAQVPLDLLQFHGDETPAYCAGFARPYVKALRMKPDVDFYAFAGDFQQARGLLLDAWDADHFGGTGKTFDWERVSPTAGSSRIILAGGLNPANVAKAITTLRPWAVDVSSGVEQAPGIKSSALIQQFISEVHRV